MNKKVMFLAGFVFLLLFFACEDNSIVSVDNDNIIDIEIEKENSPRIIKEKGSFSFGLDGDDFSGITNEVVDFSSEHIVLAINLEDYKSGTCKLTINSEYNNELFSKTITSNIIYSEVVEFDDFPEQIILEFSDFTGTMKMAFAEED